MSQRGNRNALVHGGESVAQIRPAARAQKRRFLRQVGLKASDLDGVALALLDNWSRAQAKVALLDAYFDEHGLLDASGEPRPAAKIYFTALNCARLAAVRLREHLRDRHADPVAALQDYIDAEYRESNGN
ncbi:MAG: hypothetical protein H0V79_10950 [Actinobacteria bacterium]|nr:hypothetical protein [Actinomycetota bacterium]